MNCEYIRQNELHERYLLNRLSDAEKVEYENHTKGCASCREELQKEREIITGIREIGLQEMKAEISKQVEEVRAQKKSIDWQMILKVAAVLFIIAIIPSTIYYFRTNSGKQLSQLLKSEKLEPKYESVGHGQMQVEDKSKTSQKPGQPSEKITAPVKEAVQKDKEYAAENIPDRRLTNASESASGEVGRGYAAKKKVAEEMSDSILGNKPSIVQSQSVILGTAEKEDLLKKISGGTQYRFIGSDNEKENIPKLETQEAPQLQKYDEVNSQNLRSNYKISKKAPASYIREGFQNLLFKSNQKAILIHLLPSPQELPLNKETNLPETIDIQIIKRDSLEWEMNWYINKGFLNYDPSQMEITIKDQTMYVAILKNYIYTIDTDNNNTKAILEK